MTKGFRHTSWKVGLFAVFILSVSILGCGKYVRLDNSSEVPSVHAIHNFIMVPLTRQATDYTCGVAALQSILYYYGEEFRAEKLVEMIQPTPKGGTRYSRIVDFAKSLNFQVEIRTDITLDDLKRLIDQRKPVILLIQAWPESPVDYTQDYDDGHYAIAVGYAARIYTSWTLPRSATTTSSQYRTFSVAGMIKMAGLS